MALPSNGADGPRYLYAIIPNPDWRQVPDRLDDEVYFIQGERFSAVVRDAVASPFDLRDRQELALLLLRHQQVIERVMTWTSILPVKFGTVAPDGQAVSRSLANGTAAFADAFERMKGKSQFEILVTWDPEPVFASIAAEPEVVQLKQELTTDGYGAYLVAASRLGALVKWFFVRRRNKLADGIAQVLRQISQDAVPNALMDDRMVLNMALLIEDDRTAALDDCLETLDASYEGKLTFRCIGPLPPHSFATVEITFLEAGKITRARRLLELDAVQDARTLQAAYRRLAKQAHPDTAAGGGDGERIAELKDAFTTLSSYVDAGGPVVVTVSRTEAASAAGGG